MGRSPCCDKVGLKKGPWTPEEDQKLLAYVEEHGHGSWRALPAKAGLQRCGKSCRLRWTNYLRPDIKRGKISLQEEQTIIQLHALLGNRWSAIAAHLPKRTDNEIKNYWNTHVKKRLAKMGIDPITHKPRTDAILSGEARPKQAADLSHMAQWESARLEAEARLARQSKLRSTGLSPNPIMINKPDQFTASPSAPWCFDELKVLNGAFTDDELVGNSSAGACEAEKDWKRLENSTKLPEYRDELDNSKLLASGFNNTDHDAPCGNFMDTFTDLLVSGSSGGPKEDGGIMRGNNSNGREHYCEDYNNYWNSILSLVNSSPSDSPVF